MVKEISNTYTLSCKDIGSKDCGFSVTTHSTEEIKKAIFAHAKYAHPEKLDNMSEEQKEGMMKIIDKKFFTKKN